MTTDHREFLEPLINQYAEETDQKRKADILALLYSWIDLRCAESETQGGQSMLDVTNKALGKLNNQGRQ